MRNEFTLEGIRQRLANGAFAAEQESLIASMSAADQWLAHGNAGKWQAALDALAQGQSPHDALQALHPWRKGPLKIGPVDIDTEWRSDWKWERVVPHIDALADRRVLDIGGGNGYFAWRMAQAGAKAVLNIDPVLLFYAQFLAVDYFTTSNNVSMLPLTFEELGALDPFDTIFSMGVLYHRRSPIEHIDAIHERLRPGGQVVLETLVIEGDESQVLVPQSRYARMRNVWFIPSAALAVRWLQRCGFEQVEVVDEGQTSLDEQRTTPWMRFESLQQSLNPNDQSLTVEGYPAPRRAVIVGRKKI